MNKILVFLQNVKHDGSYIEAGTVLETEADAFLDLIAAGAAKVIEGANTVEEGAEMLKTQVDAALAAKASSLAAAPKDVWAPTPEAPAAPAAPEAPAAPDAPAAPAAPEAPVAPVVGPGDVAPAPVDPALTGETL